MQSISLIQGSKSVEAASYSRKARSEKAEHPVQDRKDSFVPSGEVPDPAKAKASKNNFGDFDVDAFRAEIRAKLVEQIQQAKKTLEDSGVKIDWVDDIPYQVDPEEEAAQVPEEWNAENTSQRIVDFALQFRSQAPELSDEEYIEQIRGAIQEGFRLAKDDIGALPGPSAKLFNDTYKLAMEKLDQTLEGWKQAQAA